MRTEYLKIVNQEELLILAEEFESVGEQISAEETEPEESGKNSAEEQNSDGEEFNSESEQEVMPETECVEFNEEQTADLLEAALVYSAECAAMSYLARAEQYRAGLAKKLLHKGIEKSVVNRALDYLEQIHYLDDERFAGAWLRTRSIDHAEGRSRLEAELAARGIGKEAARNALNEFFEDKDQLEICRRAYNKKKKIQKDPEKIRASLVRNGFSWNEIKQVMSEDSAI